jgi:alpha-beta hydrolase superfamily lysophospholipase
MCDCARSFRVPVLILHGGKDFFTDEQAIRDFAACIPTGTPVTVRHYPDSHHLLMYDQQKAKVFRDIEIWLQRLRRDP